MALESLDYTAPAYEGRAKAIKRKLQEAERLLAQVRAEEAEEARLAAEYGPRLEGEA